MPARTISVDPEQPDPAAVAEAAAIVKAGGLVAFPTETVYGLGANALDAGAVERLFRAKGRPATDPIIVHLADAAQLSTVAQSVPAVARALADRFWPGPLTLILPKQPAVPAAITAGLPNVGVRVPAHPVAHALLRAAGVPIAAPSANTFSRPSPTHADHVLADLYDAIDLILDAGVTPIGVESTVLDLTSDPPRVLRPGGVPVEALRELIPALVTARVVSDVDRAQHAPGQLLRHYAPLAPLTLYTGDVALVVERLAADARTRVASGTRVGVLAPEEDLLDLAPRLAAVAASGRVVTARCGSRKRPEEAARELFAALRTLEAAGVDEILASAPAEAGIGRAIIDRLTRAAEGRVIQCESRS